MDVDSFRNLMNEFETILETFVGKGDREDLSDRIRIKLSPAYEKILFEGNEKFKVYVAKESSGYFVDVMYTKETPRMTQVNECELFMKVLDGKFVEIRRQDSK